MGKFDIKYALWVKEYDELMLDGIRVLHINSVFDSEPFRIVKHLFEHPLVKAYLQNIEHADYVGNGNFYSHTFKEEFLYNKLSSGCKLMCLLVMRHPALSTNYIPLASIGPSLVDYFFRMLEITSDYMELHVILNNFIQSCNDQQDISGVFVNSELKGRRVRTPLDLRIAKSALSDFKSQDKDDPEFITLDECFEVCNTFWAHLRNGSDNFNETLDLTQNHALRSPI